MKMIERKKKRRTLILAEDKLAARRAAMGEPEKVLYLRVSNKDLKVENQISEFQRRFPELANIRQVRDVVEGDGDRKNLFKLFEELAPGSTIYSVALDRLTRSVKSLTEIIEACEEREITLFSIRQGDLLKLDRLVLYIHGYIAEMEKENLKLRTVEGIARSRKENENNPERGDHWGYGIAKFQGKKVKRAGRKVNQKYIEALDDARDLKSRGYPLRRIAQILTQMHDFEFSEPNVSRMLNYGHG